MSDWNDNKTKVKDIFDSIRNFGLTGIVFYVGIQNLTKPSIFTFINYISLITGILMVLLSIYLFYINTSLFYRLVRKQYILGHIGSLFYFCVPALVFMLGVNIFTQTAFKFKLDNGKNIGELTINDLKQLDNELAEKQP